MHASFESLELADAPLLFIARAKCSQEGMYSVEFTSKESIQRHEPFSQNEKMVFGKFGAILGRGKQWPNVEKKGD
jgi:hypothetical protein